MIQTIGIMIACYIITRMTSAAVRQGERAESGLVRVLAVITILVAAWGIVSLIRGGESVAELAGVESTESSEGDEVMSSYDHTMRASQLLSQMPPVDGTNNEEVQKIMAEIEFHNREAERLRALGR